VSLNGRPPRDPRAAALDRRRRRAAVDDPAVVLEAGAAYLAARPRSVAETSAHLVAAGYRAELIEHALARLLDLRILDDRAFGAAWIASRDRSRPRSTSALRRELEAKGLDDALIADLLQARETDARSSHTPMAATDTLHAGPRRSAGAPPSGRPGPSGRASREGSEPRPGTGAAPRVSGHEDDPDADELGMDADEAAARRLLSRKAALLARETDPARRRAKAWSLLARNGFSADLCARLAGTADEGPGGDGPDRDSGAEDDPADHAGNATDHEPALGAVDDADAGDGGPVAGSGTRGSAASGSLRRTPLRPGTGLVRKTPLARGSGLSRRPPTR
jgi:hypothetical protein